MALSVFIFRAQGAHLPRIFSLPLGQIGPTSFSSSISAHAGSCLQFDGFSSVAKAACGALRNPAAGHALATGIRICLSATLFAVGRLSVNPKTMLGDSSTLAPCFVYVFLFYVLLAFGVFSCIDAFAMQALYLSKLLM